MKVSVAIITYNQAAFIHQALDSVLMQKTEFPFEIVIGEDDSSDGTRDIVKEYQAKHPKQIKLLLHDRKDVLCINGRPTGRRNFVKTFQACTGQYVALLEGDDYWTSPRKLQEQVDCLEQNPQCTVCFHKVEIYNQQQGTLQPYFHTYDRAVYSAEDLLAGRVAIQLCSVMVRNGLVKEFPDWFFRVAIGDQPFLVLHAKHGDMRVVDKAMAVYRIHPGSYWTQGTVHTEWSSTTAIDRILTTRAYNEIIYPQLPQRRLRHAVLGRIASLNYELACIYERQKNWPKMLGSLLVAWRVRRTPGFRRKLRRACFRSLLHQGRQRTT